MAVGRTARVFEPSRRDVPYRRAIIVGLTGASFAGKTYSALRMATGFKRVLGGKISIIDTEADRARHYEDYFEFEHVPFPPPHGPLDYLDAINGCVANGATIIIVDSMTHEHDGAGGVLEQIEDFIERKEAEYADKGWNFNRETFNFSAQIVPKRQRKQLNQRIVQLGKDVVFILCYQAAEKIRPRKKGEKDEQGKPLREPENMGWQPITTSKLPYDMTVRFLLTPASDGVPLLLPPNPEEQKLIKMPKQFLGWFKEGEQISEAMGERLAKWAAGTTGVQALPPNVPAPAEYSKCQSMEEFDALEKRRSAAWKNLQTDMKSSLKTASDKAKQRLSAPAERVPYTIESATAALKAAATDEARAAVWSDIQADYEKAGVDVPLELDDANATAKERLRQLF